MAEFTPNYRLHQWEPTDSFLRTDFNRDFEKIDTALAQLARGAEDSAYNIYNLMLQNDYEGKYTGYKKALMFDGFTDESGIAEKDDVLIIRENALRLSQTGEESWTDVATGNYIAPYYSEIYTATHTAGGTGLLSGFRFTIKNVSPETLTLEVWSGSAQVRQQQVTFPAKTGTHDVTLDEPLLLLPGDTYRLGFPKGGSSALSIALSTGNYLAGTAFITPLGAEEGQMSAVTQELPEACSQVRLWARFGGGTVTPALEGAELVLHSTGTARTLNGEECTECEWRGSVPDGDTLALSWALTAGAENCVLYDYGLLLL